MGQCCRGERGICSDWSPAESSNEWKMIGNAGGGWHSLDKPSGKERGTSLPSDGTVSER